MENDVELTSEEMELANQLVRQAREHFKTHPQDHYWLFMNEGVVG